MGKSQDEIAFNKALETSGRIKIQNTYSHVLIQWSLNYHAMNFEVLSCCC